jgi:hypothetical protein
MRHLDFGGLRVAVSLDAVWATGLDPFLDRATTTGPSTSVDLTLDLTVAADARLELAAAERQATLAIPERRLPVPDDDPTVAIAVLQAAARCLAVIRADDVALLHGGAVVCADGRAVAVLDGGRGQGKTSLAMALGLGQGQLLADEFLFASVLNQSVVTRPAPRLPWHIREDMAAELLPQGPNSRLAFPDDLGLGTKSKSLVRIEVVMVPDVSLAPGIVVRTPRQAAARLLVAAVTDHRAKLLDPSLDHVSLFSTRDQVISANGATKEETGDRAANDVHQRLATLPTLLVGIGAPQDIVRTTEAVRRVLAEQ